MGLTSSDLELNKENTSEDKYGSLFRNVVLCFLISGAASQPLGSFIPYLRDSYSLSYSVSGILLSCQSIGNFAAMILAGFLPYYIGRRKTILSMAVWMGVAYLIFVTGLGSPYLLVAAFFMTGISRGGNSSFCNTMISTLPGSRAQRGFNICHGCFSLGAFTSPILLIIFSKLSPEYGWRITSGIILFFIIIQLYTYFTMYIPPVAEVSTSGKAKKKIDFSFVSSFPFWISGIILFSYIAVEYALLGWIVTYFQDSGMLSDNLSQLMNSLFCICMFAGRMLGGALTGKVSRKVLLTIDGIGIAVFLTLLIRADSAAQIVIGIIGSSLSCATIYPTAYSIGAEIVRGNDTGCSLLMFLGSAGGIIAPAIVGAVAEKSGITAGMNTILIFGATLITSIIISDIFIVKGKDFKK